MTDPRKKSRFQLRWTPSEEETIRMAAVARGLTVSEFVRRAALVAAAMPLLREEHITQDDRVLTPAGGSEDL